VMDFLKEGRLLQITEPISYTFAYPSNFTLHPYPNRCDAEHMGNPSNRRAFRK
jgi:hypothetical protein